MGWIKVWLADLARPFTLWAMGFSGAYATVIVANKVADGNDGAWVLGAIGATVSALYAGKALEVANISKHTAQVEVERVKVAQSTETPTEPHERPPWER